MLIKVYCHQKKRMEIKYEYFYNFVRRKEKDYSCFITNFEIVSSAPYKISERNQKSTRKLLKEYFAEVLYRF